MHAGVPTELHVYPDVFHGAEGFAPESGHTMRMLRDQFSALGRALHG